MVLEIAILPIKPDKTDRIEQLGREIAEYRRKPENQPKGWHSFRFFRAIEDPNRFVLHLTWDTVEDHKNSGQSEFGRQVSKVIQECLDGEPVVHHYNLVDTCAVGEIRI